MRYLFRRTKEQGVVNTLFKFISVPLTFLRDYSCPMAEREAWNRNRAAILPVTMPFAFFALSGKFDFFSGDEDAISSNIFYGALTGILLIPGLIIAILIRFKTKASSGPDLLISTYAIISFVMSIAWISFTSDCIIDLLRLFGFITNLPRPLLALTILSWGNCLGDLTADLAMTKKGFAEMAITGTLAGPIFNILVGMGLANALNIFNSPKPFEATIRLSIYKYDVEAEKLVFDEQSVLPLVMILAQLAALICLLANAMKNEYNIHFKFNLLNTFMYCVVVIFLVSYSVIVQPDL